MIAILLTTFNGEKYLAEQINSIIQQSNSEWNLYIRDDGSTDGTISIIKDYVKKFPNLIFYKEDTLGNLGPGRSFMHLLSKVDADYYMFCDQDDVWLNTKVEYSLAFLKSIEKQYGIDSPIGIFTDLEVVDSNLNLLMPSLWKGDNRDPSLISSFYKQWVNRHATYGCTQMFNSSAKKIVLPYRQFPGTIGAHDNWVAYILIKLGHYNYLPIPTIKYRQHSSNVVGVCSNSTTTHEVQGMLRKPSAFFAKLKKDRIRATLMPFKVSFFKIICYRIFQTIKDLITKK